MMDRISGRVALLVVVVASLLVVLLGWFVLISPEKSKADKARSADQRYEHATRGGDEPARRPCPGVRAWSRRGCSRRRFPTTHGSLRFSASSRPRPRSRASSWTRLLRSRFCPEPAAETPADLADRQGPRFRVAELPAAPPHVGRSSRRPGQGDRAVVHGRRDSVQRHSAHTRGRQRRLDGRADPGDGGAERVRLLADVRRRPSGGAHDDEYLSRQRHALMASVGLSTGKRQSSAFAAKAAAKARRQKIIAVVLMVGLVGVLAYEVSDTLEGRPGQKTARPGDRARHLAVPPATSELQDTVADAASRTCRRPVLGHGAG